METHGAGRAVAAEHQRACIVAEQRAGHSAEMREGRRDALAPIVAALIEKRFDEEAARVAEHRDQEKDPDAHAGNRQPLLAEVDLQLVARRGFHPDGRQRGHALRASKVGHRPLDGPTLIAQPRSAAAAAPRPHCRPPAPRRASGPPRAARRSAAERPVEPAAPA